jgi:hypothetical protein
MKYSLKDFQGNEITVPDDKARRIAEESGLLEIEVSGQTHYINPKNIASIKPQQGQETIDTSHRIDRPDHRGKDSPAKEELRKRFN